MKRLLLVPVLCVSLAALGCGRTEKPSDMGVGDAGISGGITGGTGGQG